MQFVRVFCMTSWSSNMFVVPLCLLKALKKHSFCSISQLTKSICTDLLNSTPCTSLFKTVLQAGFFNQFYTQLLTVSCICSLLQRMACELVLQDLIKQDIWYLLCVSYAISVTMEGNYFSQFTLSRFILFPLLMNLHFFFPKWCFWTKNALYTETTMEKLRALLEGHRSKKEAKFHLSGDIKLKTLCTFCENVLSQSNVSNTNCLSLCRLKTECVVAVQWLQYCQTDSI